MICPRCLNKRVVRVRGLLDACPTCAAEAEEEYRIETAGDRHRKKENDPGKKAIAS